MKKNLYPIYALLLVTLISINSCTKKDTVNTQTVSYYMQTYENCNLYGVGTVYTVVDGFGISPYDVQQAFVTAGVTYDLTKVTSSKLSSLKATAISGNFDEVASIEVYIKISGASGDGIQIAHTENIPASATAVSMTLNGAEMKQFLGVASEVTIKIDQKAFSGSMPCVDLNTGVVQATVTK